MSEKVGVHTLVRGDVQGIGYRYFVLRKAKSLGIVGWVKNLDSGDVEIEAVGERNILEKFIESLKTEHPWATIKEIKATWGKAIADFNEFTIRL